MGENIKIKFVKGDASKIGDANDNEHGNDRIESGDSSENESVQDSETQAPESSENLTEKITLLENESKSNYDRFLRVAADFENYKKRSAKQMEDLQKFATQNLLTDFLSVVDNLERAITTVNEDPQSKTSVLEGLNMTLREALRVFEKHGVTPFESCGRTFDPKYHQAMMQEETSACPENTILSEFQKGYMIHDRLLRPAMVVVAKAEEKGDPNSENNSSND
jgi:molecular chaperone GrpE